MSRTYHSKREYLKNREDAAIAEARARTSRHPDGTRAKGLRNDMKGYIDYKQTKNRFGDAYERSSRLHRVKRWIKHAVRAKRKRSGTEEGA